MTTEELEKELWDRELSLSVFMTVMGWAAWLWCTDDPALGVVIGEGDTLERAVRDALGGWDGKYPEAKN